MYIKIHILCLRSSIMDHLNLHEEYVHTRYMTIHTNPPTSIEIILYLVYGIKFIF